MPSLTALKIVRASIAYLVMSHVGELEDTSLLERPLIEFLAEYVVCRVLQPTGRSDPTKKIEINTTYLAYDACMLSLLHIDSEPDMETL